MGEILFSLKSDLNIAEKDGSQPRKLFTVDGIPSLPSVSPDGERIVFTLRVPPHGPISIDEAEADGSNRHVLVNSGPANRVCCAQWTPDGRYVVYQKSHEGRTDLWVLCQRQMIMS
jgi:Tol biopolymer transport system component